jgi:hypothetical protein
MPNIRDVIENETRAVDGMTPHQVARYRDSHRGALPPGSVPAYDESQMTPQEVMKFRDAHGGRSPREYADHLRGQATSR